MPFNIVPADVFFSFFSFFSVKIRLIHTNLGTVDVLKFCIPTKVSDKMAYANSADQDQTAPLGAV